MALQLQGHATASGGLAQESLNPTEWLDLACLGQPELGHVAGLAAGCLISGHLSKDSWALYYTSLPPAGWCGHGPMVHCVAMKTIGLHALPPLSACTCHSKTCSCLEAAGIVPC